MNFCKALEGNGEIKLLTVLSREAPRWKSRVISGRQPFKESWAGPCNCSVAQFGYHADGLMERFSLLKVVNFMLWEGKVIATLPNNIRGICLQLFPWKGFWQADKVIDKDVIGRAVASLLPSLLRQRLEALPERLHHKRVALSLQCGFRPQSERNRASHCFVSLLQKNASKKFDGSASAPFWTHAGTVALSTMVSWNVLAKCPFKHKHPLRLLSLGDGRTKHVCKTSKRLQNTFLT